MKQALLIWLRRGPRCLTSLAVATLVALLVTKHRKPRKESSIHVTRKKRYKDGKEMRKKMGVVDASPSARSGDTGGIVEVECTARPREGEQHCDRAEQGKCHAEKEKQYRREVRQRSLVPYPPLEWASTLVALLEVNEHCQPQEGEQHDHREPLLGLPDKPRPALDRAGPAAGGALPAELDRRFSPVPLPALPDMALETRVKRPLTLGRLGALLLVLELVLVLVLVLMPATGAGFSALEAA